MDMERRYLEAGMVLAYRILRDVANHLPTDEPTQAVLSRDAQVWLETFSKEVELARKFEREGAGTEAIERWEGKPKRVGVRKLGGAGFGALARQER